MDLAIQHTDIQHNDTQHSNTIMLSVAFYLFLC
jgi:hypothetical protein